MTGEPKAQTPAPSSDAAGNQRVPAVPGEAQVTRPDKAQRRDMSGSILGDFHLLRKLGSGGMGDVYLAQQQSLKRSVALKLLREELTADETASRRFAVEAEAAAKLTHSNIVQIYAFSQAGDRHYMALEYVQGMNLRDFVTKKGPMPARLAVKVMEQVAAAIQHAGEAGIVHRDIKPDNILLTRRGEVKVTDFGLARLRVGKPIDLTQTGVTMGTPLYMSPEQVEGTPLDTRSDLYSFGVMCYFMLSGRPPYSGETALAVAVQHIKGEAEPIARVRPDLPAGLCRIVEKLMARNPDERYQSGRHVLRDLSKLRGELAHAESTAEAEAAESASEAVPPPVIESGPPSRRRIFGVDALRRHAVRWFTATVVVGLVGGAGAGWFLRAPDLRPRQSDFELKPPAVSWESVPVQKTPREQYEYALLVGQHENAEAAWLAVVNHPDAESTWTRQALMQLGKHFLEVKQLDKAEQLYAELAASPDRATQVVGDVGRAAVLSLQDRPQDSLESLWNVVKDDSQVRRDRLLLGMVFWTFERNYRNLGKEWDREIRRWADDRLRELRAGQPGGGPTGFDTPPGGRSPNG